jgi:hypothetical protein
MTGSQVSNSTTVRSLAQYYHWYIADRGIRIYLHAAMVDRLQAAVLAGLEAGSGGREYGGILLGRVEQDGDHTNTFIDDFVAVPCSYSEGPLYLLSDRDTAGLESALLRAAFAACDSPGAQPVLGYYRSHTRAGLFLGPGDVSLIESYFTGPASVFMLVKAVRSTKACTAGFFFWEDGRIQSEFSSLEVALGQISPEGLAGGVADGMVDLPDDLEQMFREAVLSEPSGDVTASPPDDLPFLSDEPHKTRSAWAGLALRAGMMVLATVALVISMIGYLGAPRRGVDNVAASAPSSGSLGLQVEPRAKDLLVTWNQRAPGILNAHRGVLSIRDGGGLRNLNLDRTQLATGSVLYTPASDDIQFRLEVYDVKDANSVQSIHVLRPGVR